MRDESNLASELFGPETRSDGQGVRGAQESPLDGRHSHCSAGDEPELGGALTEGASPSRESTNDQTLRSEASKLSSEAKSEGHFHKWPRSEPLSIEPLAVQNCSSSASSPLSARRHTELGSKASALVAAVPTSREGKSAWLKKLACEERLALYLVRLLGGHVRGLDLPFSCLLHSGCVASLTRGRNRQIVCHDPALATCRREFQTIPELAVSLRTGRPYRLRGLQLALWSIRLLYETGLLELEPAWVPGVAADSPESVRRARDGFELLLRCRWFLDPRQPVAYTRSFVEPWCAIRPADSRAAIYALIGQGVIRKAGEAKSNFKHATSLYLPGRGEPK